MAGPYAVGVDVGGTKILAGVVDCGTGAVVGLSKIESLIGAAAVLDGVRDAIEQALSAAPEAARQAVTGVGLGVAGQVDRERGVLLAAPNLGGGLSNVDFRTPLHDRFGLPVHLENDVQVAALGEARFGAGRDVPLFACVFVGTGVGGALMMHGRRFTGAAGSAGEIGHIMVQAGGRLCGCGQHGHLEAYASRTAIVAALRAGLAAGQPTVLEPALRDTAQRIKSGQLLRAVQQRDRLTIRVLKQAGEYLGLGLASLINLWSPDRIVLGGGVVEKVDLLFDAAARTAKAGALPVPAAAVEITRTKLGDYSGVVGGAMLAHEAGAPRPGS